VSFLEDFNVTLCERKIVIPIKQFELMKSKGLDNIFNGRNNVIYFDTNIVEENKEKEMSFLCPFLVCKKKSFISEETLINHVKNKHKCSYNDIKKVNNHKKEVTYSLPTKMSNFRQNILLYLEMAEKLSLDISNLSIEYVNDLRCSDYSRKRENILEEVRKYETMLIFIGYIRLFYSQLLIYPKLSYQLYDYIFDDYEVKERKQFSRPKGLCKICSRKSRINHHLVPITYGGTNDFFNIAEVCKPCHDQDSFEGIFKHLRKKPKVLEEDVTCFSKSIENFKKP